MARVHRRSSPRTKKPARRPVRPDVKVPRSRLAIPEEVYSSRLARLRLSLAPLDADHLLVTNPVDVGYLSGFLGGDSYLLLPAGAQTPTIISDFRYREELEPLAHRFHLFIRKKTMPEAVVELLGDTRVRRCAFQAEHWTVGERDSAAAGVGSGKLVSSRGLVGELRKIKDEHELRLMERAIRIQEAALLDVVPTIEPGQSELEIAGKLEIAMRARGASGPAFGTIVAAGTTSSLPHYRPASRKVARGKVLLIDWGAAYEGYNGDMTRTLSLGTWQPRLREIYEIVLEAHMLAAAALGPGKYGPDIDAIARNHIARHGYGEFFGHGLGHGLGMNVHENPRLDFRVAREEIRPGNVFTNEPGIYIPGLGGVRIEDDYVITEKGCRNLCSLPRDLQWATLR